MVLLDTMRATDSQVWKKKWFVLRTGKLAYYKDERVSSPSTSQLPPHQAGVRLESSH